MQCYIMSCHDGEGKAAPAQHHARPVTTTITITIMPTKLMTAMNMTMAITIILVTTIS